MPTTIVDPLAAALGRIDEVARDGDLAAGAPLELSVALDVADPIRLPDGKVIYPPYIHGEVVQIRVAEEGEAQMAFAYFVDDEAYAAALKSASRGR
jgi:hypothetical protein